MFLKALVWHLQLWIWLFGRPRSFKLVCPDSNYHSSGKLTYAEVMPRLIILAQSLLHDSAFGNLRSVWFCKSRYLIIHGKSVAMCEKEILRVLLGIGIVWTPMITQRKKSFVFSFTLSECLKENIAVDREKNLKIPFMPFTMWLYNADYMKRQI